MPPVFLGDGVGLLGSLEFSSSSALVPPGPTFIVPRVVLGGSFEVVLLGSSLQREDRVTLRAESDVCGSEGTENMDSNFVENKGEGALNDLGSVESFTVSFNNLTQTEERVWKSWPLNLKTATPSRLKICYCPSNGTNVCGSPGSFSVFAGIVDVHGPETGAVQIISNYSSAFHGVSMHLFGST